MSTHATLFSGSTKGRRPTPSNVPDQGNHTVGEDFSINIKFTSW